MFMAKINAIIDCGSLLNAEPAKSVERWHYSHKVAIISNILPQPFLKVAMHTKNSKWEAIFRINGTI